MAFILGLAPAFGAIAALNSWATNGWRITAHKGWRWSEEIAVVTGGCGGIGKELVTGLVKKGVRVAILDVIPAPEEFNGNTAILYLNTDITSEAAVAEAGAAIRRTYGEPSILINNAGLGAAHSILDTPAEYLPKIFGVNAIALWLLAKEFLPKMIESNKGHVANINSVTSYMALPSMVDYCASKAAGLAFHEGLTCELKTKYKAYGIITSVVQPTWVRTPMSPENADEIERKQGKMLSPAYVAEKTLEQIFSCRGGQVVLPDSLSFTSSMKGWPNWAQELLRDVMGRASLL
ncbi:hypothetical protein B0J13DRAFT_658357 [Dactylonectria estremocensis]|uniref:Short-chain dehydrogenase/reductase 3 n=1 Tax=Dactylonectria estremocensis TaxID=1079267 RepID=A0A9P9JA36_9HYPO|nr:hypothetical protein B0J13DRAFT_658357 [Dactylonectria estremocensis]